jgi:hypothetical protein
MSRLRFSLRRKAEGGGQLKTLTTVTSEAEAELIHVRLLDAGIQTISQRTIGGPEWGSSGARQVLVSEQDLDRARAILQPDQRLSDEDLARSSDEAGRNATGR